MCVRISVNYAAFQPFLLPHKHYTKTTMSNTYNRYDTELTFKRFEKANNRKQEARAWRRVESEKGDGNREWRGLDRSNRRRKSHQNKVVSDEIDKIEMDLIPQKVK